MSLSDIKFDEENSLILVHKGISIHGDLLIPHDAQSIVLFAFHSASERFHPGNRSIASEFHRSGLGTFLVDLLTEEEAQGLKNANPCVSTGKRPRARHGFVIKEHRTVDFLAERAGVVIEWLKKNPSTRSFKLGCWASDSSAAACLRAAVEHWDLKALCLKGSRIDLAESFLPLIQPATLWIACRDNADTARMMEKKFQLLACPKKLTMVPGGERDFDEPGAGVMAAKYAKDWFLRYFTKEAS
ncbi:MAG: hypothetical protein WC732_05995 [Candidatus Omnitrophota bacterium]